MSKINKVKCQMSKINKVNFDGACLRSSSGHFLTNYDNVLSNFFSGILDMLFPTFKNLQTFDI